MGIEDIFRLGDRTIAQRERIEQLEAINAELLTALEDLFKLHVAAWCPGPEFAQASKAIVDRAEAAIAKAKGET
jgi:hypothetical protein